MKDDALKNVYHYMRCVSISVTLERVQRIKHICHCNEKYNLYDKNPENALLKIDFYTLMYRQKYDY